MDEHEKDPWLQEDEFYQVLRHFQDNELESEFYNLYCTQGVDMGVVGLGRMC